MCLPGLGGSNQNGYISSLVRPLIKSGFKTAIIIYRGSAGLYITNPVLYCGYSW